VNNRDRLSKGCFRDLQRLQEVLHHQNMGDKLPSEPEASPRTGASAAPEADVSASPRYTLPTDLDAAMRHLDDQQLDRLATAVLEERTRRRGSLKAKNSQPHAQVDASSLPLGKLNAVRAAFKAGVTPARIAREFGISRTEVQKALARSAAK
jgi:hypothetical protein